MHLDDFEPLAALLTFLTLVALAHPAGVRIEEMAASRVPAALAFAFRVTSLSVALAGMHRVRTAGSTLARQRQLFRWLTIALALGTAGWVAAHVG